MTHSPPTAPISTTAAAIQKLGGTKAVAEMFGVSVNTISHWRVRDRFPPHTYFAISDALTQCGLSADRHLWRLPSQDRKAAE